MALSTHIMFGTFNVPARYVAIQAVLSRVGKAFTVEMHHQRAEQAKPFTWIGKRRSASAA